MRDKHTDQVMLDILKPVNHVTLTPTVISFSWPPEHLGIDQLLVLFSMVTPKVGGPHFPLQAAQFTYLNKAALDTSITQFGFRDTV